MRFYFDGGRYYRPGGPFLVRNQFSSVEIFLSPQTGVNCSISNYKKSDLVLDNGVFLMIFSLFIMAIVIMPLKVCLRKICDLEVLFD